MVKRFSFLILSFLPFCCFAADLLSQEDAYRILRESGFRWRQTEVLSRDAGAKSAQARSAFLPHVHLSMRQYFAKVNPLKYGFQTATDITFLAIGSTGIEVGMFLYDQSSIDRLNAASSNQNLTVAQTEQYQADLTYLMLLQFLNTQRLKKKIEMIEASIARSEEILKIAQTRVSSGLGVKIDLMRAEGLVAAEQLKKLDADVNFAKAKQELATTLGKVELTDELEALNFEELSYPVVEKPSEEMVQSRPDVRVSRLTVEASRHLENASRRDWWPKVALFGDVGMFNLGGIAGFGASSLNGMGGVQVSMPLYSGGYGWGKTEEEAVRTQKAEYQQSHTELEARSQLLLVLSQLKTTRLAVDLSKRQVDIATEELRLAKQKFQIGSASGFDVSNTFVNLANANDSSVEATFAYEVTKVNYFKNIGNFKAYFESRKKG